METFWVLPMDAHTGVTVSANEPHSTSTNSVWSVTPGKVNDVQLEPIRLVASQATLTVG